MNYLKKILTGPHGYHVVYDVDGPPKENDTYTCNHCGAIRIVEQVLPQARCKRCMFLVCEVCAPRGACHPVTNPNRWEFMDSGEEKGRKQLIIDRGYA